MNNDKELRQETKPEISGQHCIAFRKTYIFHVLSLSMYLAGKKGKKRGKMHQNQLQAGAS